LQLKARVIDYANNKVIEYMEDWIVTKTVMKKSFVLNDFKSVIAFVQLIAFEAESMNHHPVIRILYNKIDIELSTHDAGNIVTEKDKTLADKIDNIYQHHFN